MKTTLAAIIIGLGLFGGMTCAEAVTIELYTGSGRPGEQPWLAFTNQFGASETLVSNNGNKVNLNTTANNSIYAGYSNYYSSINPSTGTPILISKNNAFPTLDRTSGYTLNFSVQVNSESHNGTMALTVLASMLLLSATIRKVLSLVSGIMKSGRRTLVLPKARVILLTPNL